MKHLQDTCREAEARNTAAMHALRQNLMMYEAQFGQLEGAANRSGFAVSALQKENHEAQQRILELESRLR